MHYEDTHGALPANLYLQLDNTTRENRNNVLFGFMASLKERDVFDKIILGFLPIGHTHNEPDQVKPFFLFVNLFQVASRCSIACRTQDIRSLDRLHEILRTCYRLVIQIPSFYRV